MVANAFAELAGAIGRATGRNWLPEEVAAGFLAVAVENMAGAIKQISVQRGHDVSAYTLCCYGGAGGQHACPAADALSIRRILVHPLAGVLSAYGMGLADTVVHRQHAVEAILDDQLIGELSALLDDLQADAAREIAQQLGDSVDPVCKRLLHCRYEGSDTCLAVAHGPLDGVRAEFEQIHRMRFGYAWPRKNLVVEFVEVEVIHTPQAPPAPVALEGPDRDGRVEAVHDCYLDGAWRRTPFHLRRRLKPAAWIDGLR